MGETTETTEREQEVCEARSRLKKIEDKVRSKKREQDEGKNGRN